MLFSDGCLLHHCRLPRQCWCHFLVDQRNLTNMSLRAVQAMMAMQPPSSFQVILECRNWKLQSGSFLTCIGQKGITAHHRLLCHCALPDSLQPASTHVQHHCHHRQDSACNIQIQGCLPSLHRRWPIFDRLTPTTSLRNLLETSGRNHFSCFWT